MGEPETGFTATAGGKRRGQITYLAHLALANQSELEKQWKRGYSAKKEARQRYGF